MRDDRCNIAVQTDRDEYMDLKRLSDYSSMSVSTLRKALTDPVHPLPHFRPGGGKIFVRRSEFDEWMAHSRREGPDLNGLVSEIAKEVAQ